MGRLVLAPDRDLFGVPWAALQIRGRPVIDRFEVVQIPSAWVAIRQKRRREEEGERPAPGRALVVGALGPADEEEVRAVVAPSSLARQVAALPALKNGWRECRDVARALAPREVRFLFDRETLRRHGGAPGGGLATPERLVAELGRAEIAHIVAHGAFHPLAPMRSVLFLERGETGRALRALDLAGLDLRRVELISLAACQTGVSGAQAGAEPIGFLRALLGGGAASVLLVDWEVDDRTAARLFSSFYSKLRRQEKSTALRQAQLEVRRRLRHPYWWAGVSLYGGL
jgi:CHAT domain-containing protein